MLSIHQQIPSNTKPSHMYKVIAKVIAKAAIVALSCCLTISILSKISKISPSDYQSSPLPSTSFQAAARFYEQISPVIYSATEDLYSARKIFWISDNAEQCPAPDQSKFGTATDSSQLQWLLDQAEDYLGVEDTLFSTNTVLFPGSEINYYLDESIFTVTWQELHHNYAYTISEVVISHPSQLRRYVTEGPNLFTTTRMCQMNNAVLAVSGDFFKCREPGIVINNSEVIRVRMGNKLDTCYVDDHGDLHFTYAGDITTIEQAEAYIEENNIQFSLSFGPILIDNGQVQPLESYPIGEVFDNYPRAAFGQRGELHYLIVTANARGLSWNAPTIPIFTQVLSSFGCDKFYTLDGGRTGSIALNGELMNPVADNYKDGQRMISDIFFFASAIPNHKDQSVD